MLEPINFLVKEEFNQVTEQDFQDLCLWLVANGNEDDLILEIAANGIHWQDLNKHKKYILEKAGIGNMSKLEKLKKIEYKLVESFKNGELELIDLIKKMDSLCVSHSAYDDFGIWYSLCESLGYYDNKKGNLIYKLNPKNPLQSAKKILLENNKI